MSTGGLRYTNRIAPFNAILVLGERKERQNWTWAGVGLEMNVLSLDYKWLLCSCLATGRIVAYGPPMPGLLEPKGSLSALYVSMQLG